MTRSWTRRLRPRTLAGRLVALVLLAVLSAQAIALWIFADERHQAFERLRGERVVEQLVPVVRVLALTPSASHGAIVAALAGRPLALALGPEPAVAPGPRAEHHPLARRLARDLGPAARAVRVEPIRRERGFLEDEEGEEDDRPWRRARRVAAVSIALPDGRWLNARSDLPPSVPGFARPYGVMLALLVGLLVLAVLVGTRRATRPLAALALAAERLGRGEAGAPLPEQGPEEVRRAVAAFNRMQERLARFIADRTRLLAALGHDLRTPITSLRLRAELLEDEEARAKIVATLDEMQRMVETTLAFARDEAMGEPVREVDLRALVEGVVEDLAELGRDARLLESERLVARVRPAALRRALRNLVENALAYGTRARVRLTRRGSEAVVTVDDDGPGIPPERLEEVFEPFVRLEASRSSETGGVGLGLSIARGIARGHGGEVVLANRPEGGLRAELKLPLDPQRPEPGR